MPNIDGLLVSERIIIFPGSHSDDGPTVSKNDVIRSLCAVIAREWDTVTTRQVEELVLGREALLPTRFGPLLAVPHAIIPGKEQSRLAAAVVHAGVLWDNDKDNPVRLVLLLVGGASDHLAVLSEVARRMENDEILHRLIASVTPHEFLTAFSRAGEKAMPRRLKESRR